MDTGGTWTHDILRAKQAFSQLNYWPIKNWWHPSESNRVILFFRQMHQPWLLECQLKYKHNIKLMVGEERFELPMFTLRDQFYRLGLDHHPSSSPIKYWKVFLFYHFRMIRDSLTFLTSPITDNYISNCRPDTLFSRVGNIN